MKPFLYGLSLSLCIQDILNGTVYEENVTQIIAGTACETQESFDRVLHSYAKTYWCKDPLQGVIIATRLYCTGKIDQPRLRNEPIPMQGLGDFDKRWTLTEDEARQRSQEGSVV